jgi:hypothetical protein
MLDEEIVNKVNEHMSKGYKFSYEEDFISACNVWGELWDYVKSVMESDGYDINSFDEDFLEFNNYEDGDFSDECLYNWAGDYENVLALVGEDDKIYYQKRIDFCTEFLERLSLEGYLEEYFEYENDYHNYMEQRYHEIAYIVNMKGVLAESYIKIGYKEKGMKLFKQAIEEYPKHKRKLKKWADKYQ